MHNSKSGFSFQLFKQETIFMTTQKMYEARIVPAVGGSPITVTTPANDTTQSKKMIEREYGPVKQWIKLPQQTK